MPFADLPEKKSAGLVRGDRRYRATDPAESYVVCKCSRPDCWTRDLLPLRSHMAALFRAICALGYAERFALYERSDDPWPGVIYSLQMAASLDDLFADPSYVSDDESGFWCGDAWDREEEEREAASKYAAALIMFNFAWTAYEAAIEISAENLFPKDKVAVRARRLLQSEADQASMIVALDMSYRVAKHICSQFGFLKNELSTIEGKYGLTGAAAAAELVRIFRNHIVHGGDPLPPDDVWPCYRFYAVTRVILLLIQYLILRHVKDPGLPVPLSINRDELGEEPANDYLRNLHYGDARWRHRSPVRGGSEPHTTF